MTHSVLTFSKQSFCRDASHGGNTYQSQQSRAKYVQVPTLNTTPDPFNVSVKISSDRLDSWEKQRDFVWDALREVSNFLLIEHTKCGQNSFKAMYTFDPEASKQYEIVAGPLPAMMTIFYCLFKLNQYECGGTVEICLETYGGKTRNCYSIDDLNNPPLPRTIYAFWTSTNFMPLALLIIDRLDAKAKEAGQLFDGMVNVTNFTESAALESPPVLVLNQKQVQQFQQLLPSIRSVYLGWISFRWHQHIFALSRDMILRMIMMQIHLV